MDPAHPDPHPTDRRHAELARLFAPDARIADRYRLIRLLGRGGMGDVWEAWDEELSVAVALKTLGHSAQARPGALRMLKQEVLLARAVAHPSVCRVYDLGRHLLGRDLPEREESGPAAAWFLTMELIRGETLRQRLDRVTRVSTAEALPLVEQMASALEAAHRAGIVHRDFKSGNVLLTRRDDRELAVVTDFGVARAFGPALDPQATTDLDPSSARAGTPAYMAPEQVRGQEAGPAADIYALGVVLYELVTGRLPFYEGSAFEIATRRLSEDPPPPSSVAADLDPRWEEVILRCLRRDPRSRFTHAEEVAHALGGHTSLDTPALYASTRDRSLPAERDSFLGRETELETVRELFDGGSRLVTLLGPGGMGKTRLALRFVWSARRAWSGGVWFADLTEAKDLGGIASAVAGAIDIPLGKADPVEQLGYAIGAQGPCVIVLDNFEQVAEHAGATVGRWLERAPEARFLVTSRVRLGAPGENVLPLEPLALEEGVRLFLDRVRNVRPGFEVPPEGMPAVRVLVALLESMPLALELAAARVRVLTIPQLVQRVRERFRLLASGPGGARVGRHATLHAAIDGSWEPLRVWEKAAFAQCSVFEGGFTLDAAESIIDLSAWPDAPWMVDVLQSLVDKSLVRTWSPPRDRTRRESEARFGLFVTLQEYAREQLQLVDSIPNGGSGPAAERAAEIRHASWFAQRGLESGGIDPRDVQNLVAASRRAIARGDLELAVDAFDAAWRVLESQGPFSAAIELGESLLRALSDLEHRREPLRARTLALLGEAERHSGRSDAARAHYADALELLRRADDRKAEAAVLMNLGVLHLTNGQMEDASANLAASLALRRELGDRAFIGPALANLGNVHYLQGRPDDARAMYEESLALYREFGDRRGEALALSSLGVLALDQGRDEAARDCYEQALVIHREMGDRRLEGSLLAHVARREVLLDHFDIARGHYEAALAIHRQLGSRRDEGFILSNLSLLLAMEGRRGEAATAVEAALAIHREVGNRRAEATDLGRKAQNLLELGQLEAARVALNEGEVLLREINAPFWLADLLCTRCDLELLSGDRELAIAAIEEAEALAARVGAGPDSELGMAVAQHRARLERG